MRRQDVIDHCLHKPGAWLDNPWGEDDHVAKVGSKIFCFFGATPLAIMVKNRPEVIAEWRARFPEHATPPPYLKKDLWNRVLLAGRGAPGIRDMRELVDDSYDLVVASLPKSKRP